MREYSDEFIQHAYEKAVELNLDPEFLKLLEQELERRNRSVSKLRLA